MSTRQALEDEVSTSHKMMTQTAVWSDDVVSAFLVDLRPKVFPPTVPMNFPGHFNSSQMLFVKPTQTQIKTN